MVNCELLGGKPCNVRDPRLEGQCGNGKNSAGNPINHRVCAVAAQHAQIHGLSVIDHGPYQVFFRNQEGVEADFRQGQWPGGDQLPPQKEKPKEEAETPISPPTLPPTPFAPLRGVQDWFRSHTTPQTEPTRIPSTEHRPVHPREPKIARLPFNPLEYLSLLVYSNHGIDELGGFEDELPTDKTFKLLVDYIAQLNPQQCGALAIVRYKGEFENYFESPVFGSDQAFVNHEDINNTGLPVIEAERAIILVQDLGELLTYYPGPGAYEVTHKLRTQATNPFPNLSIICTVSWPDCDEIAQDQILSLFPEQNSNQNNFNFLCIDR